MPVSSLVFHLSDVDEARGAAVEALRRHPAFEVGLVQDRLAPVALVTSSSDEDKTCWSWARSLPGVRQIDVVHIAFEGAE